MSLWETITGWMERDARKLTYFRIPDARTDATQPLQAIEPRRHYLRLWLTEMQWYPVAHTMVRLQFGERQVEVANVAGPPVSLAEMMATGGG